MGKSSVLSSRNTVVVPLTASIPEVAPPHLSMLSSFDAAEVQIAYESAACEYFIFSTSPSSEPRLALFEEHP